MLNGALFSVDYSEMVIVRDIDFYSLCEHHLLPFFGKCHVAYIPNGRVIGLSKIPRLVDIFARRLQLQERMTNQIAETIREKIAPLGVAVVCEGTHLCMAMRGVEKQNSYTVTSAMLGAFRDNARTRMEFLELLKLRQPGMTHSTLPLPVGVVPPRRIIRPLATASAPAGDPDAGHRPDTVDPPDAPAILNPHAHARCGSRAGTGGRSGRQRPDEEDSTEEDHPSHETRGQESADRRRPCPGRRRR